MLPAVPFYPFLGEGSPTKMDYRKKATLILTSLLEDLVIYFAEDDMKSTCTCYI